MRNETLSAHGASAIDMLVQEHDIVKGLLQRLRSVQSTDERKQCLQDLQQLLTIHNATEENLIYPAINKIAGHKLEPLKLYNETAQADMMLFELDLMIKTGDLEDFSKKAERFAKAVEEHIEDEESKAFEHIRDAAEPQEMRLLNESFLRFRESLFEGTGQQIMPGATTERGTIVSPASTTTRPLA